MDRHKIVCFTIADSQNQQYADLLVNSFKHFHPDVTFIVYDQKYLDNINYRSIDSFFYKATPFFAKELIKKYELVVKIDADSLVVGPLDDVFDDSSYDVAGVLNNNRLEPLVTCLNVPPELYLNCGLVAMRSREFIDHWWTLCHRFFFNQFQYREQDLLNILCLYGNYNIACLDNGDKWYGLNSKSEWGRFEVKQNRLICPPDPRYNTITKNIRVIHAAGGNTEKWQWSRQFKPEVVNYLKTISSDKK